MESLRRRSMRPSFFPSSVPSSPPPSPISFDVSPPNNTLSLLGNTCCCSMSRDRLLNYYGPDNPIVHHRIGSIPMLNKASSLSRLLLESGSPSRAESTLEFEAMTAVHHLSFGVQSISVSEMLPRTSELIFINVTTLEGQPYCIELTHKGWRVTSLRSDCMQGDFTKIELFTMYYETLSTLIELISPAYKLRFSEKIATRLKLLENGEEDIVAPCSSFIGSPILDRHIRDDMSNSASTDSSIAE